MDKVKYRKSLKVAFSKYVILGLLCALVFSVLLSFLFQYAQPDIFSDSKTEFYYDAEQEQGKIVTDDMQMNTLPSQMWLYNFFGIMAVAIYPICFIIFIIVASILFYKNELQKPFDILNDATNHIANNNLDFTVSYDKENEFGKLCMSFDKMRMALKDNYLEVWRQAEDRKSLNAAFAHDLRTPLTVLKGQSDMLIKYSSQMSSDKVRGTADMMKRHIERMEAYVDTMNSLQRLEDIEIEKEFVSVSDIEAQLRMTGASIYKDKGLAFTINALTNNQVKVDFSVVMQVCENLLVNALRYANSMVTLSICIKGDFLVIEIADDGKGFTEDELLNATKPFYKRNADDESEHFGMGLNISKILCEKHGGYLKLKNNNGAIITAAFRQ